jgi:hypothetical protein
LLNARRAPTGRKLATHAAATHGIKKRPTVVGVVVGSVAPNRGRNRRVVAIVFEATRSKFMAQQIAKGLVLLVVDDDEDVREVAALCLESLSFSVMPSPERQRGVAGSLPCTKTIGMVALAACAARAT